MNISISITQSKSRLHTLAAMVLTLVANLAISTVYADDSQANSDMDIATSEAQLEQMLGELNKVKKRLSKDISKQSNINQAYKKTELKIGKLAADHHRLTVEQDQLNKQLKKLRVELNALQRKQKQQQAMIGEHILQAYQIGNQSAAQVFFQQQSPETIDRQLSYLDYINQARAQRVRDYAATVEQKSAVSQSIKEKQATLETNRQQLAKQQDELSTLQQQRQQQLAKLSSNIQGNEQRIKVLNADSAALQQLLKEVSRVMAEQAKREAQQRARELAEQQRTESQSPEQQTSTKPRKTPSNDSRAMPGGDFAGARGRLPWPVNGQQHFRFGKNRPGSDVSWQGVTIRAKAGQPVQAIYAGRVIFSDWFQGQGLLMIVDHGDGYMSLYGHNESLLQDAGSWVSAGETIATVGNSGGQSMAALYFEIRHNGAPSDPNKWCSKG